MHGGMQPPEKGGAGLPPPRLRPQPGGPHLATAFAWLAPCWTSFAASATIESSLMLKVGFLFIFDCALVNSSFALSLFYYFLPLVTL
jgi:hypothetical protein